MHNPRLSADNVSESTERPAWGNSPHAQQRTDVPQALPYRSDIIIRVEPPCQTHKPLIPNETRLERPESAPSPDRGPSVVTR
ncbi:protein of unknown function [Thauera humireducens]|nr:protein of unknown function [Thauera humireducens]